MLEVKDHRLSFLLIVVLKEESQNFELALGKFNFHSLSLNSLEHSLLELKRPCQKVDSGKVRIEHFQSLLYGLLYERNESGRFVFEQTAQLSIAQFLGLFQTQLGNI